MNQKTILLLFGGESAEHDVSVMSARNVVAAIDSAKFKVELCYITRSGEWRYLPEMTDDLEAAGQTLTPVLGKKKFVTDTGNDIVPDVILPILHGPNGEDGTVQGLASLLHIPIVGCGVLASAVCMDKAVAKEVLAKAGIPVVPYELHFAHMATPSYEQMVGALGGGVLFVKPANMGSSVGVSRVTNAEEFDAALVEAHKYDDKVLIERGIDARELEVAMLGGGVEEIQASRVGEIVAQGEFYSYDSKYDASTTSEMVIPAKNVSEEVEAEIRRYAKWAWLAVGGQGISRIDFFLSPEGEIYLNEINTLPGFTSYSMYPNLWENEGISYSELIERLVANALIKQ